MKYNLSDEFDRKSAITRFKSLLDKGCRIELTSLQRRSGNQNRYLHLILGWFAHEYGSTLAYVKENYYKRLCNADLYVLEKDDEFVGRVEELRSSRDLTTEQMSLSIERFRNWSSSEGGIYLPSADEQGFLEMIEVELSKDRRYL